MLNFVEANVLRMAGRMTLIEAIAWEEGFWLPHTRAARNHNPGNLEKGKFTQAHGAIGYDVVYAIFPDDQTGFEAMQSLLQNHYAGKTVANAISMWAPPKENPTAAYIENVCKWTGLQSGQIINDFPLDLISGGGIDARTGSQGSSNPVVAAVPSNNTPNS